MKKKIAIAILVIASYVGIALFANSIITEKKQLQEDIKEQILVINRQVSESKRLERKTKDYLKYSMTDDCIYYAGEEATSYCQCVMNFAVENNSVERLIDMDSGFDEEALDIEINKAFEKCSYLSI